MYDEAWLARLQPDTAFSDGTGRQRLVDLCSGKAWLSLAARWSAPDSAGQLEREFGLRERMSREIAEFPVALVKTQDGPVLVFEDHGALPLERSERPLPLAAWLDIATSAADALAHVHSHKIVHCAINRENLRMRPGGGIILAGFGRAIDAEDPLDLPRAASDVSLPYASPELADRANPRGDVRSDLYSLGATLYELLTGQRLFNVSTPAEWLHAHVAMRPRRPSTIRTGLPEALDDILLRLLAKDPAERYSHAAALSADLAICRRMLEETGQIVPFPLAGQKAPGRNGGARVIGRETQLRALREASHRVETTGQAEIVVIRGAPGSGKSSLVEHIRAELPRWTGLVGKCDQNQRQTPYLPLTQAIAAVVEQFARHSTEQAAAIRTRLHDQLDGKGRLISELVPGFAKIVSDLPSVPDLPADQALARLNATLAKVVSITVEPPAPTILFIDDIQWADDSTWSFLHHLAAAPFSHLLVVLALRDNEPPARHLLDLLGERARESGTRLTSLALPPLGPAELGRLIDSQLGEIAARDRFVSAIADRTLGNPFFAAQLLQALSEDGVLRFDPLAQAWDWDEEALARYRGSDDADLIQRRLAALPPATLDLLRAFAWIGPRSCRSLLAKALDCAPAEVDEAAAPAFAGGLLTRDNDRVAFAHDRVFEAAYALTPAEQRPAHHARIARLLLSSQDENEAEDAFDIAHHIQLAEPAGFEEADRVPFLNALILAARRAKGAAAVEQAERYLDLADRLATQQGEGPALARAVLLLRCDCLVLQGRMDGASAIADTLLDRAESACDRAEAYRLRANILTLQSDYEGAIRAGLAGLALLGIVLERHPSEAELRAAYEAVLHARARRGIGELVGLPVAASAATEAKMSLLATLIASIFVDDGLSFLHAAKMAELSLTEGMAPSSTHGFAWFGVLVAHHYGAYAEGCDYAQLAIMLSERNGWQAGRAAALVAADQVSAWTKPMPYALSLATEARRQALAHGDAAYACYASNHIVSDLLAMGRPIAHVIEEAQNGLALARRFGFRDIVRLISAQILFADRLENGNVSRHAPFGGADAGFDELGAADTSQTTLFFEWLYAGMAAFHYGDLRTAQAYLDHADILAWAVPAHINLADLHLYRTLTILTLGAGRALDPALAERVEGSRKRFDELAALNPATFLGRHLLLEAETTRHAGASLEALRLYEQAAAACSENERVHELGMIHERAAELARQCGLESAALHFARSARNAFIRWGASGLAARLEQGYPMLALDREQETRIGTIEQHQLDAAVALEAARALSGEIQLDQVIEKLMRAMIVHAGARRGVLLATRNDALLIEATGSVIGDDVVVDVQTRVARDDIVPIGLIRKAVEEQVPQIVQDATQDLAQAPRHFGTRAMMALPLVKQNRLTAVLYLENELTAHVFNPQRIAMLDMLAPQAANALDAARAYAELVVEHKRRMESDSALQNARADLARNSRLITMGSLAASIAHEINNPLASVSGQASAGVRWLSRAEPNVEEAIKCLHAARSGAERAVEIVRELRALAKQAPARIEIIDLSGLIRTVLALTGTEIELRQVSPLVALEDCSISGNGVQLQQVVVNLISNALDAMGQIAAPEGGHRLTIRSHVAEGAVAVSVEDTGSGISDEAISRIFDPFFTTKETGMGMGLAICRSIIEAHDGKLEVERMAEGGTRFQFRLPLES
ncbi:MAG: AAA family ATPase [Novosphingobium sp.]|nr:AAA family ATPase [Novosphingobium sp.]